jgi:hypothetical protein
MTRSTRVLRRGLALLGLIALFGSAVMHQPRAQSLQAASVAWMLFVDDMHLDFRNTGRLRTFARTVVNELAQERDLIAMWTSGPSAVFTDFTASGAPLPQLKEIVGNCGNGVYRDLWTVQRSLGNLLCDVQRKGRRR